VRQLVTVTWVTEDEKAAVDVATEIFNWASKGLSSITIKTQREVTK
jgi:hypothetical protein